MITHTGEHLDIPEKAQLSESMVQAMTPLLAGIARKGAALYERAFPIAENFYYYDNYSKEVSFLPALGDDALPATGTLRFSTGFESSSVHNFLLITQENDQTLSIAKDYKVQAGESHVVEVRATPTHSAEGYDFGDFAVSVFKRIWRGGEHGKIQLEPELERLAIASAHVRALNGSIVRANKIVNREYAHRSTLSRDEAGESS